MGSGGGLPRIQNRMPDCQMRYNTRKQPSLLCSVCGTSNILKYANDF